MRVRAGSVDIDGFNSFVGNEHEWRAGRELELSQTPAERTDKYFGMLNLQLFIFITLAIIQLLAISIN